MVRRLNDREVSSQCTVISRLFHQYVGVSKKLQYIGWFRERIKKA